MFCYSSCHSLEWEINYENTRHMSNERLRDPQMIFCANQSNISAIKSYATFNHNFSYLIANLLSETIVC